MAGDDSARLPSFRAESAGQGDDLLVALLDRQADLPGVVRLRQWTLAALAPRPGETALDVGSGTGSEVVALSKRVGRQGRAIGVDTSPAMLEVARARAGENAESTVEFLEGNAYALPLPDDSVDVVRCERVFQHLDDPVAATAEIIRVLRPGARVVLVDSDWYTAIAHPGDAEVRERLSQVMRAGTANPASGRRLRGLLARAGCVIDDIASEAVIWDEDSIRALTGVMTAAGRAAGIVTDAEIDTLVADLDEGLAAGDYHLSVTMFAVLAHLP